MESNEDLPDADKLLFTVDLVDYLIIKTRPNFGNKTLNILERVDRLRNFTYNHLTRTIKKALNIIDINQDRSVYNDFEKMMDERRVNKKSFIEYANYYREHHLPDGFRAKPFLMYCDRIANMAGYFLSYGIEDGADIAVELILPAFPDNGMHYETWNKLTYAAQTLVVLGSIYYGGNDSSESSSESVDSSENGDSNCDSLDMDVNVSSPDDMPNRKLDMVSETTIKTSEYVNASNGSPRTNAISMSESLLELREMVKRQSSEGAGFAVLPFK